MSSGEKRPVAQVLPLAQELLELLRPSCHRIEIAGSLRRGKPEVGDIELVAIPRIVPITIKGAADLFGHVATCQREVNMLWDQLDLVAGRSYTKCGEKYRQFVFKGVKVDLFTAAAQSWGWIFLVRTGSKDFSHYVAGCLNQNGLSSRDGRIFRMGGDYIDTPTEADVFRLAGIAFRDPKQRT